MQRNLLFLLVFLLGNQLTEAKTRTKIEWNSNFGFYELKIQNDKNFSSGQITIKFPTENTFIYDIHSKIEGLKVQTQRFYAPKECPDCDFQRFIFNNSSNIENNNWQTLLSFKVTGPVKTGFVEICDLPMITVKNTQISIANSMINNGVQEGISLESETKAPIISSSYAKQNIYTTFGLGVDFMTEEAIISTNWFGEKSNISFYIYDINGNLVSATTTLMEEGAQQFRIKIGSFPSGKYFVKAAVGNKEIILNDGFVI